MTTLTDDECMRVCVNACDSLNATRVHELRGETTTILSEAGLLDVARAVERAVLAKVATPAPAVAQPVGVIDDDGAAWAYGTPGGRFAPGTLLYGPVALAAPAVAAERQDALCDAAYVAGAQAGFNAAASNDPDALSNLLASRAGYLPVLRETRPAAPAVADAFEGEEWEPLAMALAAEEHDDIHHLIWEGGPVPEPWGEVWQRYEGDARRMIQLVRQHTTTSAPAVAAEPAEWDGKLSVGLQRRLNALRLEVEPDIVSDLSHAVRDEFRAVCTDRATLRHMLTAMQAKVPVAEGGTAPDPIP